MNEINLCPTRFENARSKLITYGYRIFDDNTAIYFNGWESIPDSNLEFIAQIVEDCNDNVAPEGVKELLLHVYEHELAVYVDDYSYRFHQIAATLSFLQN